MRGMAWMTAGLAGVVVLGACERTPPPQTGAGSLSSNTPECPHSWDSTRAPSAAWRTVNVPEFNDCQKFLQLGAAGQNRSFTSGYFAIFANPDTATLLRFAAETAPPQGVPVAFIYAEGAYAPLHIGPGGNCLYFFRPNEKWQAIMTHAVTDPGGQALCADEADLSEGQGLHVEIRPTGGMENPDYPPVARWDWDGQHHYIGVRCPDATAWCEVGPTSGFPSSPSHPQYARSAAPKERRTVEVKGWYDEQYLARCDGGSCTPTALIGTILPDSTLDDATSYGPTWTPVARAAIEIDGTVPEAANAQDDLKWYKTKFNLELTSEGPPLKLNEIATCHDDGATLCAVPEPYRSGCPAAVPGETEHGQWWLRIVGAASGDTTYRCVIRRPVTTGTGHVVGAARWRWLLNDETFWYRCVEGCCEAEGLGG